MKSPKATAKENVIAALEKRLRAVRLDISSNQFKIRSLSREQQIFKKERKELTDLINLLEKTK